MAKSKGDKDEKFVVVQRFMDKANSAKIYEVGEDVSKLEDERIKELVEKGLVKEDDK